MSDAAGTRLARMLAMVPYISRRPGLSLADLAAEFDVDVDQVTADLNLLMVCGLPGYYPDDLIDVVLDEDGGTVSIAFDAGLERPIRLTGDEAMALTVALRALAELPGLVDAAAVHSALAKLEAISAVGANAPAGPSGLPGAPAAEADGDGPAAPVQIAAADPAPALPAVRAALDARRQVWMRYYTASRDVVTERTVDPIRLLVTEGHAYLEAYCHLAGAVRHFRVDRIDQVRVLDEPAQAPLWVESAVPERMFHPDPQLPAATLRLLPASHWIAEYYPVEVVSDGRDAGAPAPGGPVAPGGAPTPGDLVVRMQAGDEWLIRLVLGQSGSVAVIDRPDLMAEVGRRAAAALAGYGEGVPSVEDGPGPVVPA
ncbi:helix-turn-helix transcriptional regulator [Nakamurella leprariae]|uniref:WYL domain-containing protein n=1 Tax=Nakamurella leprariae TaxID=2803911 RepID=A0A939C134_9ACTN|nr:WYL domain-containing protein [Nakamurella leprariae]MBM9466767.1 WYL domain-containing protein [Nakamurella leprariae]